MPKRRTTPIFLGLEEYKQVFFLLSPKPENSLLLCVSTIQRPPERVPCQMVPLLWLLIPLQLQQFSTSQTRIWECLKKFHPWWIPVYGACCNKRVNTQWLIHPHREAFMTCQYWKDIFYTSHSRVYHCTMLCLQWVDYERVYPLNVLFNFQHCGGHRSFWLYPYDFRSHWPTTQATPRKQASPESLGSWVVLHSFLRNMAGIPLSGVREPQHTRSRGKHQKWCLHIEYISPSPVWEFFCLFLSG